MSSLLLSVTTQIFIYPTLYFGRSKKVTANVLTARTDAYFKTMKKSLIILTATAVAVGVLPLTACKKEHKQTSKYVICADYDDESNRLTATCDFTFFNDTDNELTELKFNLWGNAYRQDAKVKPISESSRAKAYYDGASYGGQSVQNVENCGGWEVGGEDENILTVTLNEPVYPDCTAQVSIEYTLDLAKVNHRTGVTQSTVNLGNFYPVLCVYTTEGFAENPYYCYGDPFVSECADYEVTFKLPREYALATSGKEISRTVAGEVTSCTFELKNARDFAAVLSKEFKTVTRQTSGCDVTVYYVGEEQPDKQLDVACESIDYFTRTFGEYAYPTLSVVITPLCVSGMEYPALTMISDDLSEDDGIYTIVHENAHQWWYAMVGNDQVNCAWQDEGLAEYSTMCFFENYSAYGITRTSALGNAIKSYRAYYSVYNQIFGKADTTMTRCLKDFSGEYEYVNVAYNKGLLAFESVRTAMGDKKFFNALKSYFEANKFKIASQEELISHFAALHDVEGIFNSYIEGKVVI